MMLLPALRWLEQVKWCRPLAVLVRCALVLCRCLNRAWVSIHTKAFERPGLSEALTGASSSRKSFQRKIGRQAGAHRFHLKEYSTNGGRFGICTQLRPGAEYLVLWVIASPSSPFIGREPSTVSRGICHWHSTGDVE